MIKFSTKIQVILLVCLFYSCSSSNNKLVQIDFSPDSSAIILSAIDPVGLLQLKNSEVTDSARLNWVSVTQAGAEIAGEVNIQGDTILFIPKSPFERGKAYLVSTPLNANFGGAREILKGKVNYQLKPQQKLLER